jgi:diguanylate cyclase (GGDEF)-like protein/PAS domain S-box-containing protein
MNSKTYTPSASWLDLMLDAICAVDAEGRFVYVSAACERIFGYTPEEMIGKAMIEMVAPEDRARTLSVANEIMSGHHKLNFENHYVRKDGQVIHIMWSARWSEADQLRIAVAHDITGRKQGEMVLKQYKAAIDTTHEGFWIADDQGKLLEVNQAYAKMSGYSIDELQGMHVTQLEAIEQSQDQVKAHIARITSQGWDVFETRHRCKDGREIELEVSASYVPDARQFVAFLRDISQHKEDQKKIQFLAQIYAAQSQANHARIESKDETTLFNRICQIVVEFGGMNLAWIGVNDEKSGLIKPVAAYGSQTEYLKNIIISSRDDVPAGQGPTGTAYREMRSIFIQDQRANPMLAYWREQTNKYGWGSLGAVPIIRGGVSYAVLVFYHTVEHVFTEETISLLNEMGVNIGRGLDRFDLEAEKYKAEESMRLAATIYESTAEAIMVTDENNCIVDINPAFTDITGYTLEEVRGKSPRIFRSGKHDQFFYQEMWRSIQDEGHWQGEIWDRRKDGELHAKWLSISAIRRPDGSLYRYVAQFSDITEKKRKDELILTQANFDALTNLPNRRLLADRIQQAMASSVRSGLYGSLIALDMDHFKQLNDTSGHSVGDKLLIEVARRLQTCVREEDTVARMGGDEFIVVLNDFSTDQSEASIQTGQVAEKIRNQLSNFYQLGEIEYHTTPSIGIILFRGNAESQETLLAHVDAAMYQAKAKGRNTICFFDTSMQEALEKRSQLERALRVALSHRELLLYYQLQVDNLGRPIGVEALLRWTHPELGMVSPAQFIPLAEETGLILPIGHWVLETACAQLARWQSDPDLRHLGIAVNVSARQFRESTFVAQICDVLKKSGIKPELLKLELTESLVLENVDDTISKMKELKTLGIKFSMDDFGTGYSSLSYLSRLPIDQLKIDQSFVRDITTDQHDAAIVQTIISMAQSLGMEAIAEGVETEEQREFLELRGCKAYQGYLFAKPLPIGELERRLHG